MFKKEISKRLLVTLVWLLIITLLRWHWQWSLINLWLGGLIGTFFLEIDHLLYVLFVYPQELTSLRFKRFLEQRRFKQALFLLMDTKGERQRLIFHSSLFQLVLLSCCFFVLTSTDSLLGAGLVMAMALSLLRGEFGALLRGQEARLREKLFGQIDKEISFNNQQFFVLLMLLFFLGLNLLLV